MFESIVNEINSSRFALNVNGERMSTLQAAKYHLEEGDLIKLSFPKIKIDQAQLSRGGIDFNPDKINLQVQNAGLEIKFHLDPAMIEQLRNSPGFTPVIINIQPITDLKMYLGL
jgi:hypothetical protein